MYIHYCIIFVNHKITAHKILSSHSDWLAEIKIICLTIPTLNNITLKFYLVLTTITVLTEAFSLLLNLF